MVMRNVTVRGSTWREVIAQFDDLVQANLVREFVGYTLIMISGVIFVIFFNEFIGNNSGALYGVILLVLLFLIVYIMEFFPATMINREIQKGFIRVNGRRFRVTDDTEVKIRVDRHIIVKITNLMPVPDEEIKMGAYM